MGAVHDCEHLASVVPQGGVTVNLIGITEETSLRESYVD